ncbi:hypothetical protein MLD38_038004 [Melastoma candidum]|uniref:Uncharacterized protein n=1 Tax=Melastoma candidum TaxID=119954 RepID=A0ACB9KYP7_9MYRT|nr:hypothetical protein MLD38_038004 [Melastoma candidum]
MFKKEGIVLKGQARAAPSITPVGKELSTHFPFLLYALFPFSTSHTFTQTWESMGFREDDNGPHQHNKVINSQGRGTRRRRKGIHHGATSLASMESLSIPLVQVVVLSADMSCAECQKRVAEVMSRMNETESVEVNVLEKKVILSCKYPNQTPPSPTI